ncbi:MAG: hypothetical protein M1820_001104 [Bogoriella megaspora]|nr:MAG: hypothetical protein M1820_001104 [Bogoriella megaspora]
MSAINAPTFPQPSSFAPQQSSSSGVLIMSPTTSRVLLQDSTEAKLRLYEFLRSLSIPYETLRTYVTEKFDLPLFVYDKHMVPAELLRVLGKFEVVNAFEYSHEFMTKAFLNGYTRWAVKDETYPVALSTETALGENAKTEGMLIFGLSGEDIAMIEEEVPELCGLKEVQVEVPFGNGEQMALVEALAFLAKTRFAEFSVHTVPLKQGHWGLKEALEEQ